MSQSLAKTAHDAATKRISRLDFRNTSLKIMRLEGDFSQASREAEHLLMAVALVSFSTDECDAIELISFAPMATTVPLDMKNAYMTEL